MNEEFSRMIRPGNYGEEKKNGIIYIKRYNKWQTILYRIVKFIQHWFWFFGFPFHDSIFGECTEDFNCCCNIGRFHILRLNKCIIAILIILFLLFFVDIKQSNANEPKITLKWSYESKTTIFQNICIDGFMWVHVINKKSGDMVIKQIFAVKDVPKTCLND